MLLVGTFDSYNKQNLLDQRGVYIREQSPASINSTQYRSINTALDQNLEEGKYNIHPVRYFNYPAGSLSSYMRVIGIDHEAPWAFSEVKPNSIKSGRFIKSSDEAMVSEGFNVPLNWTETGLSSMFASLQVDNSIAFEGNQDQMTLEVKGVFKESPRMQQPWLIISNDAFDDLISLLGKTSSTDVFYSEVAYIATGGLFAVVFDLFSFAVGAVGGLIVATLYAYLITRFRRREVAILKAIGFNARNVRITLLAEILTVAFLGFAAATLVIEGYIRLTAGSEYIASLFTMPYTTILISGSVVVLTCIPGFLLISWRILAVRPIEIFKER
ncbi:MAG: FtsX-like permease family protein [Candidatus Hodarchaeales archaeon]